MATISSDVMHIRNMMEFACNDTADCLRFVNMMTEYQGLGDEQMASFIVRIFFTYVRSEGEYMDAGGNRFDANHIFGYLSDIAMKKLMRILLKSTIFDEPSRMLKTLDKEMKCYV